MKKYILLLSLLSVLLALPAAAQNFVTPEDLKAWIEKGKPLMIIDIQPAEDFAEKHIRGSIETNATPAQTDEEKRRLNSIIPQILSREDDVVIVRSGAKMGRIGGFNTYDYLKERGVPAKRLYILDGGIEAWPYDNLLIKGGKEKGRGKY